VATVSTVTETYPWTNLAPGHHVAALDVSDLCGNQTFVESPFDFTDDPPMVRSISVDSTAPKKPILTIDASDDVGVQRIDILRDGTLVTSLTAAPYKVQLDTSTWTDGNHTVVARAYDAGGQTGQQSTIVKADNTAPVVTMTAQHLGLGTILWTATASDALSTLSEVSMGALLIGLPLARDFSAPPYQVTTTMPPNSDSANFYIGIWATDKFGNVGNREDHEGDLQRHRRLARVHCHTRGRLLTPPTWAPALASARPSCRPS